MKLTCVHVQVSKRRDPLQPVGRYSSGTGNTARNGAASSPNGALAAVETRSIVAAPPTSIVKFPGPGYRVILPSGDITPETVLPAPKPLLHESPGVNSDTLCCRLPFPILTPMVMLNLLKRNLHRLTEIQMELHLLQLSQ